MISFRGDAHKLYLKLHKAAANHQPLKSLEEIREISNIQQFYQRLDNAELNGIRYRMIKEKNGTGMIPILISAAPWLMFIFSKQLQSWLFSKGKYLWLGFVAVYMVTVFSSIVIHFREKAWASVHIEIIEDILAERAKRNEGATKLD